MRILTLTQKVRSVWRLSSSLSMATGSHEEEPTIASSDPERQIVPESPITRLPPELLALILIAWHALSPIHAEFLTPSETWLAALRVSKQWRTVALACPHLWSRIRIAPNVAHAVARAETYLRRSGNCTLSIDIKLGVGVGSRQDALIARVLAQAPRAEFLVVRGLSSLTSPGTLNALRATLATPAPRLCALILQDILSESSGAAATPPLLPGRLFTAAAPHLHFLSLHGSLPTPARPLPAPIAHRLTGLSLRTAGAPALTFHADVIDILQPMYNLQALTIEWACTPSTPLGTARALVVDAALGRPRPPRCPLPALRHLALAVDMDAAVVLLARLVLPRLEDVVLRPLDGEQWLTEQLATLLRRLFPSPHVPADECAYALRLLTPDPASSSGFAAELYTLHSSPASPPPSQPTLLRLRLFLIDDPHLTTTLLAALPLHLVTHVSTTRHPAAGAALPPLLPLLPVLHTLYLGHAQDAPALALLLARLAGAHTLPALRTLGLRLNEASARAAPIGPLEACLRARKELNCPLAEVRIVPVYAEEKQWDAVRRRLQPFVTKCVVKVEACVSLGDGVAMNGNVDVRAGLLPRWGGHVWSEAGPRAQAQTER